MVPTQRISITTARPHTIEPVQESGTAALSFLAVLPLMAIPFENQYTVLGWSVAKLTIMPLLGAVLMLRPNRLATVWKHPVFISAMAFLVWGTLSEAVQPFSDWDFLYRILQMVLYASLVAAAVSSRFVFKRTLLVLAFVSTALAFYLIANFYGSVAVDVMDFRAAGQARAQAFEEKSLEANLNILAYSVGMGAIVALGKLLGSRGKWLRLVWGAIYVVCAIGAMIPVSRGAFVALVTSSGLILWRNLIRGKSGIAVFILGLMAVVFMMMPGVLTARLASLAPGSQDEVQLGKQEARFRVFNSAVEAIPEYWAFGVGVGNYWKEWGADHGFGERTPWGAAVIGPHNSFFAAWIYFGLPGILLLCFTCYLAGRKRPGKGSSSWEAVVLLGILVFGVQWLLFTHNLYLKEFGVILGLVMGAPRDLSESDGQ